ncbi:aminoglycoside phosphotransferase family protein [Kineosporia sp. J2-2]|uniref:Aminoglycoside phosphotransferase family protein n=1 Tax=Kineosporia corallincola TaxID=2835133 RepID=A0ABS5TIW3_9ACTN|nr:phosphotransferase [Kineosporia corallincola]MBT0771020.1 aminoglycoside phosphotransferase family protein [Kineosporia corallincola]
MPEILSGGGVNEVWRDGARVLRPAGPWTPRVHGLLRHLRAQGFTAAPAPHGLSADGREVLDFLPGDVSNYPLTPAAASSRALVSAARLLRGYHDSTVGYLPGDGWMFPPRPPAEVVCHGDFAPHNCVMDGEEVVGIIDFDTAHPGPRLWDVAYAVYRWAPLTAAEEGFGTVAEQAVRARMFCDAYGLDVAGRAALVDQAIARLHDLVAFMRAQAAAGSRAFAAHLADGHHLLYRGDAAYLERERAGFEEHLLGP